MLENIFYSPVTHQFPTKLIVVIDQDEDTGTQFVQMIRRESPFQAILATSLAKTHNILHHLKCDLFLLRDNTLPEEDQTQLYQLAVSLDPPALLFSYNYHHEIDRRSIVKAITLLLSIHDTSSSPSAIEHDLIASS